MVRRVLEESKTQEPRGMRKKTDVGSQESSGQGHSLGCRSSLWRNMALGATQTEYFLL